jgi:hypothetical protein
VRRHIVITTVTCELLLWKAATFMHIGTNSRLVIYCVTLQARTSVYAAMRTFSPPSSSSIPAPVGLPSLIPSNWWELNGLYNFCFSYKALDRKQPQLWGAVPVYLVNAVTLQKGSRVLGTYGHFCVISEWFTYKFCLSARVLEAKRLVCSWCET